ncbi:hypothetical protein ACPWT1_02830 [Ramlibacter sp. MMS24-I3-19]|uniref:hypothetical protein n=1 Tax=Ramlibacter sp. MMS24-I3-19 TaxID=3416606 RepID=UPI003D02B049
MSEPNSPDHPGYAGMDFPTISTESKDADGPIVLGSDYVCIELPTHITRARTRQQQAMIDQAYEGWTAEM